MDRVNLTIMTIVTFIILLNEHKKKLLIHGKVKIYKNMQARNKIELKG